MAYIIHAMLPHGRMLRSMHRSPTLALQLVVELVQCNSWQGCQAKLAVVCLLLQLHGMVPPCSSAALIMYPMQVWAAAVPCACGCLQ
jgi:hypothetical protein